MTRPITRALALGLAAFGLAQAGSATTFTFTNKGTTGDTGLSSQLFAADSGSLTVKASAWHATDNNPIALSNDPIETAKLTYYQGYGMGAVYGTDTSSDGSHQIDNYTRAGQTVGYDFIMLQFSQDVTIDSIARNVYTLGDSCCHDDAAYWADTGDLLGQPSSSADIDLTRYNLGESLFTSLPGTGSAGSTALNSGKSASVWLVSSAFNKSNDGFKIASLNVTATPSAVPEPATWGMMIVGMGVVGRSMRRRRPHALPDMA